MLMLDRFERFNGVITIIGDLRLRSRWRSWLRLQLLLLFLGVIPDLPHLVLVDLPQLVLVSPSQVIFILVRGYCLSINNVANCIGKLWLVNLETLPCLLEYFLVGEKGLHSGFNLEDMLPATAAAAAAVKL